MSNVDLILSYLSGELSEREAAGFQEKLATDPLLKNEFEEVSMAYDLVRDQLRKRDESEFRARLAEVMEKEIPTHQPVMARRRTWRYIMLPLAGTLALLLSLLLIKRDPDRIFSRFFHPEKDPVVLAFNQATRGGTGLGIVYYQEGRFKESMNEMSRLLEEDPGNQLAQLYYLLASMEIELQDSAIQKLEANPVGVDHQLGQSITWYASLAMVKSDLYEEAARQLGALVRQPGPYQSDAIRMQKMLLK